MAGWQEAATTPDLSEWLREHIDEMDFGPVEATAPIRRKVTKRQPRTPRQIFDHLYGQGMSAEQALKMTQEHLSAGGDAETYGVTELDPQEWIDTRKPRPHFERLTTGKTDRPQEWFSRKKWWTEVNGPDDTDRADTHDRAMQLALQWRAMRR